MTNWEERCQELRMRVDVLERDAMAARVRGDIARDDEHANIVAWLLEYSEEFNTEDDRTSALDAVLAARNEIAQGKHRKDQRMWVAGANATVQLAQALYRERLARTYTEGLEIREKALMARIAELEAENERFRGDLISAGSRIVELEAEQHAVMAALPSLGMWEASPSGLAAEVARRLKLAEAFQLTTRETDTCVESLRGYAGYASKQRAAEMVELANRLDDDMAWAASTPNCGLPCRCTK